MHSSSNPRIHIDHPRIRNARAKFPAEGAAGIRTHVIRKDHRHNLVVGLFFRHIRQACRNGSHMFQGQDLPVVANQRDRGVSHVLAEKQVLRFSHHSGDHLYIHQARILKTERGLYFQDLEHGPVEPLPGNLSRLHGLHQRVIRSRKVGRNQQKVIARLEGLDGGAPDIAGKQMRKSGHIKRIGHDESLESQLIFKQVRDDGRGNRGHVVGIGIKRRHGHVSHHDRVDPSRDRLAEGRQLH